MKNKKEKRKRKILENADSSSLYIHGPSSSSVIFYEQQGESVAEDGKSERAIFLQEAEEKKIDSNLLDRDYAEYVSRIRKLSRRIETTNKQAKSASEQAAIATTQVRNSKIEVIGALGVFAAIVAFTVVDIQLFTQSVPLTLIVLLVFAQGFSMSFIIAVLYIFISPYKRWISVLAAFIFALVLLGIVFFSIYIDDNYTWYEDGEIEVLIQESVISSDETIRKEFDGVVDKIDDKTGENEDIIHKLEAELELLKKAELVTQSEEE